MLCLSKAQAWFRSIGWLSWLGLLLLRIWEQQNKSWAWKYIEIGNMVSLVITKEVCVEDTQEIQYE